MQKKVESERTYPKGTSPGKYDAEKLSSYNFETTSTGKVYPANGNHTSLAGSFKNENSEKIAPGNILNFPRTTSTGTVGNDGGSTKVVVGIGGNGSSTIIKSFQNLNSMEVATGNLNSGIATSTGTIVYGIGGNVMNIIKESFRMIHAILCVATRDLKFPRTASRGTVGNDDVSTEVVYGIGGNGKNTIKDSFNEIPEMHVATGNLNLRTSMNVVSGIGDNGDNTSTDMNTVRNHDRIVRNHGGSTKAVYGIGGNANNNITGSFQNIGSMEVATGNLNQQGI